MMVFTRIIACVEILDFIGLGFRLLDWEVDFIFESRRSESQTSGLISGYSFPRIPTTIATEHEKMKQVTRTRAMNKGGGARIATGVCGHELAYEYIHDMISISF